jgi:hypothetical protein
VVVFVGSRDRPESIRCVDALILASLVVSSKQLDLESILMCGKYSKERLSALRSLSQSQMHKTLPLVAGYTT